MIKHVKALRLAAKVLQKEAVGLVTAGIGRVGRMT